MEAHKSVTAKSAVSSSLVAKPKAGLCLGHRCSHTFVRRAERNRAAHGREATGEHPVCDTLPPA